MIMDERKKETERLKKERKTKLIKQQKDGVKD